MVWIFIVGLSVQPGYFRNCADVFVGLGRVGECLWAGQI